MHKTRIHMLVLITASHLKYLQIPTNDYDDAWDIMWEYNSIAAVQEGALPALKCAATNLDEASLRNNLIILRTEQLDSEGNVIPKPKEPTISPMTRPISHPAKTTELAWGSSMEGHEYQ